MKDYSGEARRKDATKKSLDVDEIIIAQEVLETINSPLSFDMLRARKKETLRVTNSNVISQTSKEILTGIRNKTKH
jgi:hypothetical protein